MKDIKYRFEDVHISNRTTSRRMAEESEISNSTLHREKKNGYLIRHRTAVKRYLTDRNKLERLKYALDNVRFVRNMQCYEFLNINDHIHVDENWFYIKIEKESYHLTPNESQLYFFHKE